MEPAIKQLYLNSKCVIRQKISKT